MHVSISQPFDVSFKPIYICNEQEYYANAIKYIVKVLDNEILSCLLATEAITMLLILSLPLRNQNLLLT